MNKRVLITGSIDAIAFKPSAFSMLFKELPSRYSHVFGDCSGMEFLNGLQLHMKPSLKYLSTRMLRMKVLT